MVLRSAEIDGDVIRKGSEEDRNVRS